MWTAMGGKDFFPKVHIILQVFQSIPTQFLTSGSLCLTANFRADFQPNLSYYWFKKNLFRIVEKMNNFCFVINLLELLKKIFIQYLTANLHCSANLANKSATQEGAFRERLGYVLEYNGPQRERGGFKKVQKSFHRICEYVLPKTNIFLMKMMICNYKRSFTTMHFCMQLLSTHIIKVSKNIVAMQYA